jgi:hypothetical protein
MSKKAVDVAGNKMRTAAFAARSVVGTVAMPCHDAVETDSGNEMDVDEGGQDIAFGLTLMAVSFIHVIYYMFYNLNTDRMV